MSSISLLVGNGYDNYYNSIYGIQAGYANQASETEYSERVAKQSGSEECKTCASRKYQDGSDENVSFKSAAHVSPEAAASAVRSHEAEHVSNAYDKAVEEDAKVVSAAVSIHTSVCPECGRTYVSGGTTTTQIRYSSSTNPYQQSRKSQDAIRYSGNNVDING